MTKSALYSSTASGEDSFTAFKCGISQRSDFASEMIACANTAHWGAAGMAQQLLLHTLSAGER